MIHRKRISHAGSGRFKVRLPEEERQLLRQLADELRAVLAASTDAPAVRRLFPTAYHDDVERDREYQALARDELLDRRLTTIEVLESTADASELDEEQITAWMAVVNDLRLVLGTKLDVDEELRDLDPDDPDAAAYAVYEYLGYLLSEIIDALAEDLPG